MNNLEKINAQILNSTTLKSELDKWRSENKRIVFTNGVFDILHLGHIDYLSKAADEGDVLIVGINTDSSVKMLDKGSSRPINDENSRASIIAALRFVDAVILFNESTPYDLINKVQPDVLVKGSDYKPEDIVGYDIVMQNGGEIKTIDFLTGYSTTLIEQRIRES